MHIAIIGAGNVGFALGKGWARAGHTITFGVTDPQQTKHQRLLEQVSGAALTTVAEAVSSAAVVVLAVPWSAVSAVLSACGDLSDRILIDVTNPLQMGADGLELALGFTTSGGEMVARLATHASVFKTLNQVGHAVMADTTGYATPPLMFVAGDDIQGKSVVMALVADLGFAALDAGPLRQARLLEPYAMLWIDQSTRRHAPATNAFAMLSKRG